jgi:dinuclear metal center YbgI/SA1388 family protein
MYTFFMSKGYNTEKLDAFFRNLLDIEGFAKADDSLNGLQVDNDGGEIKKIAFAVDACLESFKRAGQVGAGMLFVHHGLFWGIPQRLKGTLRERIKYLLDNNLSLYGVHLPLDQHPSLGNNAALAELLGIENPEPFGLYHGHKIGCKGRLKTPLSIDEARERIAYLDRPPLGIFPFGKEKNLSVAVVSGGAAMEALEAIDEGVDLYVTGESSHSVYHHALEGKLNVIAGGHYSTEVWGVRRMMEAVEVQLHIETEFIDIPTGL